MLRPKPITAYVGTNGSGKTLSSIAFALTDLKATGRPLVTNVGGLSVEHTHVSGVEELVDLLAGFGTCNVVLDEAGVMFASRDTGRNKAFEKVVQKLRHYDARLLWTAPAYMRADKILREVTQAVILCKPLIQRTQRGKAWPSTRLIFQKRFDAVGLDNSGTTMNRNAKGTGFGMVRTGRWQSSFDSFYGSSDARAAIALVESQEAAS